jgi:hypothetical protein
MNHIRQQGLGNIIIAICAGTNVILREDNPLFKFITELGIKVSTFSGSYQFSQNSDESAAIEQNRKILTSYFGATNQRRRTRILIEQCSRTIQG